MATDEQLTNITSDDISEWMFIPYTLDDDGFLSMPGLENATVGNLTQAPLPTQTCFRICGGKRILKYRLRIQRFLCAAASGMTEAIVYVKRRGYI